MSLILQAQILHLQEWNVFLTRNSTWTLPSVSLKCLFSSCLHHSAPEWESGYAQAKCRQMFLTFPCRVSLIQYCSHLQAVLLLQFPPSSKPSSSASQNLLLPFTTAATPVLHQACNTPGSSCQELPTPLSLFSAFQLYSPYLLLSICSVLLYNLCCSSSPKPL